MNYPEIYYSKEVKRILNSEPSVPDAPKAPDYIAEPKFPTIFNYGSLRMLFRIFLVVSIVLFIIGFVITEEKNYLSACSFYSSILFYIIIRVLNNKVKEYRWEHEQYKRNIELRKIYKIKYAEYKENMEKYNETLNTILSDNNIEKFRNEQLKTYFKKRKAPKFTSCDEEIVKKGISEQYFANLLAKDFTVYTNQKVRIIKGYYYPDILLVHNNIYINIEIDEPYTYEDGKPIHYAVKNLDGKYISEDEDRNTFFTYEGYEVIRLTEEQIVTKTIDCINLIKKVIYKLEKKIIKIKVPSDFIVQKWTKKEANIMATNRYRDNYIAKLNILSDNDISNQLCNTSNLNDEIINSDDLISLTSGTDNQDRDNINTEVTDEDIADRIEDSFGVIYSKDGKKLLKGSHSVTDYKVKEGVNIICDRAFGSDLFHVPSLRSIKIPDSVTDIGYNAFYFCDYLQSIEIPDGVSSIEFGTFFHCSSLSQVAIPKSVTRIDEYAFGKCSSLSHITLPEDINFISQNAFFDCPLISIYIPDEAYDKFATLLPRYKNLLREEWKYRRR